MAHGHYVIIFQFVVDQDTSGEGHFITAKTITIHRNELTSRRIIRGRGTKFEGGLMSKVKVLVGATGKGILAMQNHPSSEELDGN
jgi:hypothetical protein